MFLTLTTGGDFSFYEDTGTTPKFFWDASAEELQLGDNLLALTPVTTGTTGSRISANGGGMLRLASGGSDKMYVLDSGNVGIGIGSPSSPLHVHSTTSGLPVTSGTTQTNGVFRLTSSATSGIIDFGMNGSYPWIQATDYTGLNNNYNLLLNPNGGNVGIGTTSPDGKLHIQDGSAGVVTAAAGANDLVIETSQTSGMSILCGAGWASIIQFGGGTDNNIGNIGVNDTSGIMTMGTAKAGGTLALRTADSVNALTIDASQNLAVTSGNLSFANGQGIDFSATAGTGTSELLDDYEEGTFTPSYVGTTSGTAVHTIQIGTYLKVGNLCTVWIRLSGSQNNISGGVLIAGLPFTAANRSTYGWMNATNGTWSWTTRPRTVYVNNNTTTISMWDDSTGTIISGSMNTGTGGNNIEFQLSYKTQ
jgi:hypothetical protein